MARGKSAQPPQTSYHGWGAAPWPTTGVDRADPDNHIDGKQFSSLDWNTHPIDIAHQSQGWGPMDGPYTPVDFAAAIVMAGGTSGINCSWTQGDNTIHQAPGYADATIYADRATSLVNQSQAINVGAFQPSAAGMSATIDNAMVPNQPKENMFTMALAALKRGTGLS